MSAPRLQRTLVTAAAALAVAAPATAVAMSVLAGSGSHYDARPCYNGVTRLDPYGTSCTIPGPQHKIRGSAPDANAIIACRNIPGCLSWYVNNP